MASETIRTYFTTSTVNPAAPATGLSPVISIWKVSDNSVLVNEEAMTEVGGGWYKYTFAAYDPTTGIAFRCNSAVATTDFRYTWGGNSDDLQMAALVPASTIATEAGVTTVAGYTDSLEGSMTATNALITNLDGDLVNSTNGILASISGIPALARAEMDANSTKFASMTSTLARIAGLVHENTYVTFTYDGNSDNTTSTIQLYDTKANADTHNGTTGLVATYNMAATYAAHVPATVKVTKA